MNAYISMSVAAYVFASVNFRVRFGLNFICIYTLFFFCLYLLLGVHAKAVFSSIMFVRGPHLADVSLLAFHVIE